MQDFLLYPGYFGCLVRTVLTLFRSPILAKQHPPPFASAKVLISFPGLWSWCLVFRVLPGLGLCSAPGTQGSRTLSPLPLPENSSPVLCFVQGSLVAVWLQGHVGDTATHSTQFSSPEAPGLSTVSFPSQGLFVVPFGLCPGRRSWGGHLCWPLLELEVDSI